MDARAALDIAIEDDFDIWDVNESSDEEHLNLVASEENGSEIEVQNQILQVIELMILVQFRL